MLEIMKLIRLSCISVSLLLLLIAFSGCVNTPSDIQIPPVQNGSVNDSVIPAEPSVNVSPENVTPEIPPVFDAKIQSLSCTWTQKTNEYGAKMDCVQIVSKGTAQGPIGARIELPILSWSTDSFDCGTWTKKKGALIAVGSTCVRQEGQPETMNWMADTGVEHCPLKDYFNKDISHTVKIYMNQDIEFKQQDSKKTVCS